MECFGVIFFVCLSFSLVGYVCSFFIGLGFIFDCSDFWKVGFVRVSSFMFLFMVFVLFFLFYMYMNVELKLIL